MDKVNEYRLWEILIPDSSLPSHHTVWDNFVTNLCGGMTVLKSVQGQWSKNSTKVIKETMTPVRIWCSRYDLDKIIDFTKQHYNQDSVMIYKISDEVMFK